MAGNVYELISRVQGELSKTGISKDRKNQQQHYSFRGIDDVYQALAPLLAAHGLVILPRVISREVTERATKAGGTLFYVCVHVEFDFVSAHDGSSHTVATVGEAMDSGDKATNKSQSAAYKYACFLTFCIPTEGDNDADSTTHEPAAPAPAPAPPKAEKEALETEDAARMADDPPPKVDPPSGVANLVTEKQLKFIRMRVKDSVFTAEERDQIEREIKEGITKTRAEEWDVWLKKEEKERKAALASEARDDLPLEFDSTP